MRQRTSGELPGDEGMVTQNAPHNLDRASQVVLRILEHVGEFTPSPKVVKLVYLVDYTYFQHYGETLSGLEYQWGHCGPNALGHAIVGCADSLTGENLLERKSRLNSRGGQMHLYRLADTASPPRLPDAGEMVINDIVAQYGDFSVQKITKASKETAPFENAVQYDLLQMEQTIPAVQAEESAWKSHVSEIEEQGTISLQELTERYGLD